MTYLVTKEHRHFKAGQVIGQVPEMDTFFILGASFIMDHEEIDNWKNRGWIKEIETKGKPALNIDNVVVSDFIPCFACQYPGECKKEGKCYEDSV